VHFLNRTSDWLSNALAQPVDAPARRSRLWRLSASCAVVFLIALGVRLLHWQEYRVELELANGDPFFQGISDHYKRQAQRMLEGGGILFPSDPPVNGDAILLVHPPGYSIFIAGNSVLFGDSDKAVRFADMLADALAAVLVLLIAAELLPMSMAATAGALVALSPHLSYYSMRLSPDTLAVLPILAAIYFIIRANKKPSIIFIIAAGILLGLSCWLRSNALLLAPFLTLFAVLLFKRGKRLRYSAALLCTTAMVIAPITIRNAIVFRHFIPLSLGSGITLIEGIGDYDDEQRFGLPKMDREVQRLEAEWYGRPEYAWNLESPDGIDRDRARFSRGLAVARSNPGWFLGVMLRRAGFMLRYNDSLRHDWPFGTAMASILSSEASFSHGLDVSDEQLAWSASPSDLTAGDSIRSPHAESSIVGDGQALQLTGDDSEFGDQLASAPIAVQKNSDYLLTLPIRLEQGQMASKITTTDLRVALDSVRVPDAGLERKKRVKQSAKESGEEAGVDSREQEPATIVKLPFASGSRTEVRLVISNNGQSPVRPLAQVGRAELFAMGRTPFLWTRYPRGIIRGIQRNLYRTGCMLSLIIIGVVLLTTARRWRVLAILLAVPLYYMFAQSALHTEYRYILAIHYFLFIIAAVMIGCLLILVVRSARRLSHPFREAS